MALDPPHAQSVLLGYVAAPRPAHGSAACHSNPRGDFCSDGGDPKAKVEALYDAKTVMGPWAYMCQAHYLQYGDGLGLGMGQRLILKTK